MKKVNQHKTNLSVNDIAPTSVQSSEMQIRDDNDEITQVSQGFSPYQTNDKDDTRGYLRYLANK